MSYSASLRRVSHAVAAASLGPGHALAATLLSEVVGALFESNKEFHTQLAAVQVQIHALLSADARSGHELVQRAFETVVVGRPLALVIQDLQAAVSCYTRALPLARNKLENAMLRHQIAVCCVATSDHVLALRELVLAKQLASEWQDALAPPRKQLDAVADYRDRIHRHYHPQSIWDHIFRLPETTSGLGNLMMEAGRANKALELAKAEVERQRSETQVLIDHVQDLITSLRNA